MDPEDKKNEKVETGNASNPSPGNGQPENSKQLLDKKAEKYLRESGNIEDMPDPEEQAEAEKEMKKTTDRQ